MHKKFALYRKISITIDWIFSCYLTSIVDITTSFKLYQCLYLSDICPSIYKVKRSPPRIRHSSKRLISSIFFYYDEFSNRLSDRIA